MVQKRIAAFTLTVMLSIIVVIPIAFTSIANANFAVQPSNPSITFNSPVNTTYTVNNVSLNVTIVTYTTSWSGSPEDESYRQLEYSVDGNEFQPIEITNATIGGRKPGIPVRFDGLISLHQLSEGNHTLTVKAALDYYSYDYPQPGKNWQHTESIANAYLFIDTVVDTPIPEPIDNSLIPHPQLTIIVLAVTVAVIISISVLRLKGKL
jgi:hypothetical protein